MKTLHIIAMTAIIIFLANCGDNKEATNEKQGANNSSSEKKEAPLSKSSTQEDDITGEWEMVSSVIDTNDNLQIDEEERSQLKPVNFKDYMNLKRDGTGLFTVAQLEGRYEIKKNETTGRNDMTWYDKTNSPHNVGSIMKVTKTELHIKEYGGSGLFLWKRL